MYLSTAPNMNLEPLHREHKYHSSLGIPKEMKRREREINEEKEK